ncbi:MAG: hypothetical protein AAGF99_08245 [Bacteroidota bacterium]
MYCPLLVAAVLLLLTDVAVGQEPRDPAEDAFATRRAYVEVGGNVAPVSINVDVRVAQGYALRFGAAFGPLSSTQGNQPTRPDTGRVRGPLRYLSGTLTVSRLLGASRTVLELGGGVMGRRNRTESADARPSTVGFTGILGVRLQPRRGGFGGRLAFTPLLDRRGVHAAAGLSVMYGLP